MNIIDTHFHLWNQDLVTWLESEQGPLNRSFVADDHATASSSVGVQGGVLIEAGNTAEEQAYAQSMVAGSDRIQAYIPYQDLESSTLADELDRWQKDPKVRGVRMGFEGHPDRDVLKRLNIIEGLRQVAARGLVFEFLVEPHHLADIAALYDLIDDLSGVVEHLAKPDVIGKTDFDTWSQGMKLLAESTSVYGKLSMSMSRILWPYMQEQPGRGWPVDAVKPFVDFTVDHFGCDRLMWGSDWPVCLMAASYADTWEMMHQLTSHLNTDEQTRIFSNNAERFYGLQNA